MESGAHSSWSQLIESAEPHCTQSVKPPYWQHIQSLSHCPSEGIWWQNPVPNNWARLSNSVPGRRGISSSQCCSQLGPDNRQLYLVLLGAEAHRKTWKSCGRKQRVMEQRDGCPGEAGPGKKSASAVCADMYDDIDIIIEMEKNVQNRRKTFGYATLPVYTAKGKFAFPPDFLRTALHNTSTARPTCEHNVSNSQR